VRAFTIRGPLWRYTVTTGTREDYINPIVDGSISWRSIQSVDEDSELAFDSWQQGSYEIFSRRCATVRETRWVGTEVREHPVYDGTSGLDSFLLSMEEKVVEGQRISVLDLSLQDTPARWWANHKALLRNWDDVKQAIKYRFQDKEQLESEMQTDFQVAQLFNGEYDPKAHIEQCVT
jgi:hypothetical protein